MVGRVIGKGGETIKALQQYTGAMIQIDQSTDPTRVTIAGSAQSLQLAVSMVSDIVRGTFKGFAMLRQIAMASGLGPFAQPQPVYVQGYGFVPPSQVFAPEEGLLGGGGGGGPSMIRSPPAGPLTPPITPLRATATNSLGGMLPPETLAALLAGHGASSSSSAAAAAPSSSMNHFGGGGGGSMASDALLAQLLTQLTMQQHVKMPPSMMDQQQQQQLPPRLGQSGLDQGAIQAMLAQAGLGGGGGGQQQNYQQMNQSPSSSITQMLPGLHNSSTTATAPLSSSFPPSSTSLMFSPAQGGPLPSSSMMGGLGNGGYGSFGGSGGSAPRSSGSVSPTHSLSGALSMGAGGGTHSPVHQGGGGGATTVGSGAGFTGLSSAVQPQLARRPTSGEGSPLGRYGAIGSGLGRFETSEGGNNNNGGGGGGGYTTADVNPWSESVQQQQ